ncbi:MAG: SH3 domain-containing protein [Telluria sp.]
MAMISTTVLAIWTGAFIATLVLARYLTPRAWWRHANARALAVLAGGTCGIGMLATSALGPAAAQAEAAALPAPARQEIRLAPPSPAPAPRAGTPYLVYRDLNLRSAPAVSAKRIGTVPVHSTLVATGAVEGDWWQVEYHSGTAWASSLWLRRADENGHADVDAAEHTP